MIILWQALIMGIVEGLTEFLPVSSTGHLIVTGSIIHFQGSFANMFEIVIQLGAILAVIFYYRVRISQSLKAIFPGEWGFKLWLKMFIAFIPSAFLGLLLNNFIESHLFTPFWVAIALIVGAILMLVVENYYAENRLTDMDQVDYKKAFKIGIAQCFSLFPGMSRSASTIMGGMVVGLSIKAAAEFSFFLAIPTMIAATGYSLLKGSASISSLEWGALALGFLVSFIVALLVVGKFLSYLERHPLKNFAYYRLAAGIVMLILVITGII